MSRRNGWKVEIKKPRMCFTRFSYERYPAFRYVKDGKRAYHWEATGLSESEAKRYEEAARRDGYSVRALRPCSGRRATAASSCRETQALGAAVIAAGRCAATRTWK